MLLPAAVLLAAGEQPRMRVGPKSLTRRRTGGGAGAGEVAEGVAEGAAAVAELREVGQRAKLYKSGSEPGVSGCSSDRESSRSDLPRSGMCTSWGGVWCAVV